MRFCPFSILNDPGINPKNAENIGAPTPADQFQTALGYDSFHPMTNFHELNDLLQYLGQLAFRAPVPAYRHDAALFLELRGWASSDATPAGVPRRPASERALLVDIAERLGVLP